MPNDNYIQDPKQIARAKDYHARALAIFDSGFKTETERKDAISLLTSAYDVLVKEGVQYALWSQRTATDDRWVWDNEEAKNLDHNHNFPDLHVWAPKHAALYAAYPAQVKLGNVMRADRDAFKAAALVAKPKTKTAIKQEARNAVAKTCQICGRDIFAERGKIAHHGYQRPGDGYQTQSCYGAMHLPFEVSRDTLGEYIEILIAQIGRTKKTLSAVKNEKVALRVTYNTGKYIGRTQEKVSFEATRETFNALRDEHRPKCRWSSDLPATFDKLKDSALAGIASKLKQEQDYLKHQQARYGAWKAVAA